jgi:inosine-uridine nucleoside N-ribohydrolase
MPQTFTVILDTDIGDDIDDAFCLALMLRSPEIQIKAVSTVMGDVRHRAAMCIELCRAAGVNVPVLTGCVWPISPKPNVDWSKPRFNHKSSLDENKLEEIKIGYAANAMINESTDRIFTIGAMSNLAVALAMKPDLKDKTRLMAMAGEWVRPNFVEWNIRCDPEAAFHVCNSGTKADFIPWSIGPATQLLKDDVARLEASSDPVVKVLVDFLHQFKKHVPDKANMYDPMTVVALLRPDLFEWRTGRVSIELKDEKLYGLTHFAPDDNGPHRVAFGVKGNEAKEFMMNRLLGKG